MEIIMNNNQPTQPKKKPPKPGEAGEYIPHVNKGIAIAAIVVFLVLLIIPTLVWGALKVAYSSDAEMMAKLSPDTGENRAMASFPTTFNPEKVTVEIENWYNDNLPFRSIVYNAYITSTEKIEAPYKETLRYKIMAIFPTASQLAPPPSDLEGVATTETSAVESTEATVEDPPEFVEPPEFSDTEKVPEFLETEAPPPDFIEDEGDTEAPPPPSFIETEEDTEDVPPEFIESTPEGDNNTCEHIFGEGYVESPATCSEWGVMAYACESCGYIKRQYTNKTEHVKGDAYVESAATCSDWGVLAYPCETCGKVLSREYTAKADHVKGEGYIETPATCTDWGVVAYPCESCGKVLSKEYTAKADHVKGEGYVESPATCNDWGVMAYPCESCGKVLSREYTAKLTHDYLLKESSATAICGSYYDETYECSLCKDSYTKEVLKKHSKGTKIKTVEATYSSYGYTLVSCSDCGGEFRMAIKDRLKDTSMFLPDYINERVYEGKYNWLFYRGDNSEAYFKGTNLMTDAELQDYVNTMNTLKALCDQKGIQLQICIWPNKEQVYPEYTGITPVTQNKRIDRLVSYVTKNSDIKIIYPLAELKAANQYFDTYLKYDTHWNNAGGFVGYQAMMKSLGLETFDPYNIEMYEVGYGATGTDQDPYFNTAADLKGMAGVSYSDISGYAIKYRPEVKVKFEYGANGAGDTRHTTAANAPNDLNFVMLADSYRVMQLSYLEKDFTDCFLTHRSHVNDADVKEAIKNSDILVIAAVERLEGDILTTAKRIINILSE